MAVTWLVRSSRDYALKKKTMFWTGSGWTPQDWDAYHFTTRNDAVQFIATACDTSNRAGWVFDVVPIDPSG